jgi:hypothetical protein
VLSRRFADDRVTIHCRIPAALLGRIGSDEAVVRPHAYPALRGRADSDEDGQAREQTDAAPPRGQSLREHS